MVTLADCLIYHVHIILELPFNQCTFEEVVKDYMATLCIFIGIS